MTLTLMTEFTKFYTVIKSISAVLNVKWNLFTDFPHGKEDACLERNQKRIFLDTVTRVYFLSSGVNGEMSLVHFYNRLLTMDNGTYLKIHNSIYFIIHLFYFNIG